MLYLKKYFFVVCALHLTHSPKIKYSSRNVRVPDIARVIVLKYLPQQYACGPKPLYLSETPRLNLLEGYHPQKGTWLLGYLQISNMAIAMAPKRVRKKIWWYPSWICLPEAQDKIGNNCGKKADLRPKMTPKIRRKP